MTDHPVAEAADGRRARDAAASRGVSRRSVVGSSIESSERHVDFT
jgi:hypothetical protein